MCQDIYIIISHLVERETNIVTRIKVHASGKKFYVDSKMKNYDKFLDYIIENVDREIIEYKVRLRYQHF